MSMLIAVLVPLQYTAPVAILVFGLLATYWHSLRPGRAPRSRRRIRRATTIVHVVLIPTLVYALSVADPDLAPSRFVAAWTGVLALVGLTIFFALADSWNNIRLHNRERSGERKKASKRLREEIDAGRGRSIRARRLAGGANYMGSPIWMSQAIGRNAGVPRGAIAVDFRMGSHRRDYYWGHFHGSHTNDFNAASIGGAERRASRRRHYHYLRRTLQRKR